MFSKLLNEINLILTIGSKSIEDKLKKFIFQNKLSLFLLFINKCF